jgi:tRNA/tmRNA/rRNA uracil-C5-methylase (TrmA/RlmC/RlmD family)
MTKKKTAKEPATKRAPKAKRKVDALNLSEDAQPYIARPHRFIDLFCGIGDFRIAFEKAGGECVFSSDGKRVSR